MNRTLPILSIIAAVLAASGAALISGNAFWLLATVYSLLVGLFLILERNGIGIGTGIALLVLSLVGFLTITEVSGEEWDLGWFYRAIGPAFNVWLLVLAAAAVIAVRWDDLPFTLAVVGAVAALGATIAVFLTPELGATFPSSLPAAILALVLVAPGVMAVKEA